MSINRAKYICKNIYIHIITHIYGEYYGQLYADKFSYLDVTDTFLEKHNFANLMKVFRNR